MFIVYELESFFMPCSMAIGSGSQHIKLINNVDKIVDKCRMLLWGVRFWEYNYIVVFWTIWGYEIEYYTIAEVADKWEIS